MARTLNAALRTVRREAFVDAAQRLMQAKGYEQMSVQDVLDELGASRGAFYHYFDSKHALLEAVIDRMVDGALAAVSPIVDDRDLPALRKLERVFAGIQRFKAEVKPLILAMIEVWLSDDNALMREKFRRTTERRMVPVLAAIVKEGSGEGVFHTGSPDDVARALWWLMHGFSDQATDLFLARQANTVAFEEVERSVAANTNAFERILGLSAGSLTLIDEPTLRLWFG